MQLNDTIGLLSLTEYKTFVPIISSAHNYIKKLDDKYVENTLLVNLYGYDFIKDVKMKVRYFSNEYNDKQLVAELGDMSIFSFIPITSSDMPNSFNLNKSEDIKFIILLLI